MPTLRKILGFAVVSTLAIGVFATITPATAGAAAAGLIDKSILTKHTGDITVTQANTVLENMEIHGTLRVEAPNVTVRNVWIYTSSFWTIFVDNRKNSAVSLTIEHSEIGHSGHIGERGIGGSNITARYLDIHHVEDGIKLGENVVYDSVKVHNLASKSGSPHADAVQDDGGARNAVVRNSHLDAKSPHLSGNAAVIIKADLGSSRDILFENNYLNGGGYMVFVRKGNCCPMPQNVTFRNNRIGSDYEYGILSADGPVTWTGNVWASNGQPVDVGGSNPPPPPATTTTTKPPATTTTRPATTTTKPATTSTTSATSTTTTIASTTTTTQPTTTTTESAGVPIIGSSVPPSETANVDSVSGAIGSRQGNPMVRPLTQQTEDAMTALLALTAFVLGCYMYVRRSRIIEDQTTSWR